MYINLLSNIFKNNDLSQFSRKAMIMKSHSCTQERCGHCHQTCYHKQACSAVSQIIHLPPVRRTVDCSLSAQMDKQQAVLLFRTVTRFAHWHNLWEQTSPLGIFLLESLRECLRFKLDIYTTGLSLHVIFEKSREMKRVADNKIWRKIFQFPIFCFSGS